MASPLRLTTSLVSPAAAERAWLETRSEFEASELAMSRFLPDSDLTRLNRVAGPDARPGPVDRRLSVALGLADRASRVTDGRFDARVIADLDRLGYRGAPIETSPDRGDGRVVIVERDGAACLRAPLDLGGVGKGLALRWAAARVARTIGGRGGALIEAGGDIVAIGEPPTDDGWLVDLEDPSGGLDPVAVLGVPGGAVATSSSRLVRWEAPDGRTVHHLIDPRTGEPGGPGLLAVTVAGPDPAWAEIWSKTLFLVGATEIAGLARSRGLAAWWIRADRTLEMTSAGRLLTVWERDEDRSARAISR